MKRKLITSITSTASILIIDQGMLVLAFLFTYWLSYHSGLSPQKPYVPLSEHWLVCIIMNGYWLCVFAIFGLYGKWKYSSRFDEIILIYKMITIGAIVFVVIAFSEVRQLSSSKLIAFAYWASLIVLVGSGRMIVRTIQRIFLLKGIGRRPSLVVGTVNQVADMLKKLRMFPALGYDIKGVIPIKCPRHLKEIEGIAVLGFEEELHRIIEMYSITDVLIALQFRDEEEIFKIVSLADSFDVDYSILPGPTDALSGRMMFNQLYGLPMVRILAEPMPPWEKNVKRFMDFGISFFVLVLFSPLFFLIALAIKLDSRGPSFYVQERLGYRGKVFKLWKFRSMVTDAEKESGPVWADKNDYRVTRVGRILRLLRFDELPQFYNILRGDMSLVGPRPEREFFVEQLKIKIPYYQLRLKVKPGLTGWAQIKHCYDRSLDDVREKLKYDLYYIENMSLRMDFKILLATIFVVVTHKGAQ